MPLTYRLIKPLASTVAATCIHCPSVIAPVAVTECGLPGVSIKNRRSPVEAERPMTMLPMPLLLASPKSTRLSPLPVLSKRTQLVMVKAPPVCRPMISPEPPVSPRALCSAVLSAVCPWDPVRVSAMPLAASSRPRLAAALKA